jgi:putative ABC transport system permease protein
MNWWQRVRGRWRMEDELDAELRFHFDRLVADYVAEGLSEQQARDRARAEFGGVEAVKDDCRDARGTRWVHDIAQDVRFSARLLARERSFTCVAVLALALGIGVNNTQFTIVNAVCLRGLSIAEPDRVVEVSDRDEAHRRVPLKARQVDDLLQSRPAAIDALSAYASRPATLRDDQFAAERVVVAYVSTNAFAVIRQRPLLGRDFRLEDGRAGESDVAILAANVWRTRYGAEPGIIGRLVRLDGKPVSVIGVMPDGFKFPDNADVWQPLAAFRPSPNARALSVYGRLAEDATIGQAQEGVAAVLSHASGTVGTAGATVVPINEGYRGDITNPAWIAFITVGALLVVIACSNVANLLLARGARRGREMAMRLALGATRARIVRQLLVESAMLAAAGGLGAVLVSAAGLRLLSAAIPAGGLPYWVTLTMDGRIVLTLVAVCLGTVLLFGLAPAMQLARTSANAVIKETGAGASHDRGAARWTWLFLTCQLALTVMLLSKLDFTVQAFRAHQAREPLIAAKQILTFGIVLPADIYRETDRQLAFYRTLSERLTGPDRAVAVSVASALPLSGGVRAIAADGQLLSDSSPRIRTVSIDGAYFRALGVDIIEGQSFGDIGTTADPGGIVVNQRFAELFFPSRSAIGRRVHVASAPGSPPASADLHTIVGVVPSVRPDSSLEPEPAAYLPLAPAAISSVVVLVRTAGDASVLAPVVRDEVRRLDPNIPVNRLMTLADANWNARWNPRVASEIITTISLIALALATIGLAALTAHAVAQRSRELGIRLALGATQAGVVLLVLRRVVLQALVGVAVGSIGAKAWDPQVAAGVLAAVSLVVIAVVVGVSAWPAARAGRIEPLGMLRDQ